MFRFPPMVKNKNGEKKWCDRYDALEEHHAISTSAARPRHEVAHLAAT